MIDYEYKLLAEMCVRLEFFYSSCMKLKNAEDSELLKKIESVIIRIKETITLDTDEALTDEFIAEIILFVDSLKPINKAATIYNWLFRSSQDQLNKSINLVLNEIKAYNHELAERYLVRHHEHFLMVSDLFHYKSVFLYFKYLIMPTYIQAGIDEELQDAYDTLKEMVLIRLEKILKDDLWLLGNHAFEKLFAKFNVNGDVQKLQNAPVSLASKEKSSLKGMLLRSPYPDLVRCFSDLENEASLVSYLQKSQPEIKRIYNLLNECIVALFQLYEHFDTQPLIARGFLDEREELFNMLEGIHFAYDYLNEGNPFIMEQCETLAYKDTKWPTRNYTIKTVHERGIKYRDNYIRKNLVTIYRLQTDKTS